MSFGSTFRIAVANRLCFSMYWLSPMWPSCHGPHISLPTHQYFTAYGSDVAVFNAPLAADRVFGAVDIFDFLRGGIVVAEAGVHGDHRLGVDFMAEIEELVDADIVGIDAGPGRILARRAAVARADAVAPVVAADKVAAGPAVDRRIQLLEQSKRVATKTANVVGRHERDGADHTGCFGYFDAQPAVIGGLFRHGT